MRLRKGIRLVDVSSKFETKRYAKARGRIRLPEDVLELIKKGKVFKGDVLTVSEVAGVLGAKKVPEIIPFCHPIPIDAIEVTARVEDDAVLVEAVVSGVWRTGYEVEAVSAVSAALINIYDMCKAYTDDMVIEDIRLVEKGGGKSDWYEDVSGLKVAVIVVSDSVYSGKAEDSSGSSLCRAFEEAGAQVLGKVVVPDDRKMLREAVEGFIGSSDIIVTTGGTGASLRDITPEVSGELMVKELCGLSEAMRIFGVKFTPKSLLSRAKVGVLREGCILVNLPGSEKGALESLSIILPLLKHAWKMSKGERH